MGDWWPQIVWGLVGVLLTAALTGLATHLGWMPRRRARPGGGTGILRYPVSALAVGLGMIVVPMIAFALSLVFSPRKPDESILYTIAGFCLLPLGGAAMVANYFRVWYALVPGGMRYQPMWRRQSEIAWAGVTRVRYGTTMNLLYVDTTAGRVRMSLMLKGLPEFARAVLAEVPSAAFDAHAHITFQMLAHGYMPDEA